MPTAREGASRRRSRTSALALALALLTPRAARAYDEDSAAVLANKGLHLGFTPVLLVPPDDRPLGGGLNFDLRYGIGADPVVIGPGARLAGYFISGRFVGMALGTLRVTLPLGPLAPFVIAGLGPGALTNPGESGLALLAGGGLMIHFGRILGIGAELSYEAITGTELKELAFGPAITISFP